MQESSQSQPNYQQPPSLSKMEELAGINDRMNKNMVYLNEKENYNGKNIVSSQVDLRNQGMGGP